jgi:hypothetical protein
MRPAEAIQSFDIAGELFYQALVNGNSFFPLSLQREGNGFLAGLPSEPGLFFFLIGHSFSLQNNVKDIAIL